MKVYNWTYLLPDVAVAQVLPHSFKAFPIFRVDAAVNLSPAALSITWYWPLLCYKQSLNLHSVSKLSSHFFFKLKVKVEDGKVYVTINKSVSNGTLNNSKLLQFFISFCVKIHNIITTLNSLLIVCFTSDSEIDKAGERDVHRGTRHQTHHRADRRR